MRHHSRRSHRARPPDTGRPLNTVGLVVAGFCAICMIAHVVRCLRLGDFGLLIVMLVGFPLGIIHGFGVIVGLW